MTAADGASVDSGRFRRVLGHFATGVAVITASGDAGPAGMAVSSFTSVSLEPPLVAFLPDKSSSSWPKIEAAGSFCVNILSAGQQDLCAQFARTGADKFAGVSWRPAASGSPILDGVMAWIDCELTQTFESGDHYIAIGRVVELEADELGAPLVFFQGGYGNFMRRLAKKRAEPVDTAGAGLVQRAAGLLAERGIANSSLAEIAEATGVSTAELEAYRLSPEGIVDELIGEYVRTFHDECRQIASRSARATDIISSLLQSSFESMAANRVAVMILQNEREYLSKRPEFRYLDPLEREIKGYWLQTLDRGIAEGSFRNDLDVNLTYRFIRDVLFIAARWYHTKGSADRAALARTYTSLIRRGIAP
jgi:flavin reductase (DIM6/NTAB) family NADH-FMN oxidoreductase RutF/AcrR family transcriptional regulator